MAARQQDEKGLMHCLLLRRTVKTSASYLLGDGVYQLLLGQQTAEILSKDYSPMLKLFDLYDIEQVYVCETSLLAERGLAQADLVIEMLSHLIH